MTSSTTGNLCYLSVILYFTSNWLSLCSDMPYWQTIQTPMTIHFGVVGQKTLNETFFTNSINIGIMRSCLDKSYCIDNQQFKKVISVPSGQTNLLIVSGLFAAEIAYMFSLLLICYTCNCTFFLLGGFLWASFILLFIGLIEVERVLILNNWASWSFAVGIILIFILALTVVYMWYKYDKNRKCLEAHGSMATLI